MSESQWIFMLNSMELIQIMQVFGSQEWCRSLPQREGARTQRDPGSPRHW